MRIRTVLSLFDGIRCGVVALQRAGIQFNRYYASEIDKYAIQIAEKNFPEAIQLGDVNNWREWNIDWSSVDLIIGGSPCQGFSVAGKQLNFNDHRSKLFFVYVDILNHVKNINPNVKFLLENVKMKKEYSDAISEMLSCKPVEINSALVSAQNRKRLYWTNIGNIEQPEDKKILLKDIVHENTSTFLQDEKSYCIDANYNKAALSDYLRRGRRQQVFEELKEFIVPFDKTLQILDKEVERGKVGFFRKDSQSRRVYYIHDKAVTLCGDAGGGAAKMGQYLFGTINTPRGNNNGGIRQNGEKAPTISSSKWEHNNFLCFGCMNPERINKKQNGQRFNDGCKAYTLTGQEGHGVLIEGYIRKLTPIECERLQTLPDNYTEGVSNAQRYKMLGNGWTVDVIAHILKYLHVNKENKE